MLWDMHLCVFDVRLSFENRVRGPSWPSYFPLRPPHSPQHFQRPSGVPSYLGVDRPAIWKIKDNEWIAWKTNDKKYIWVKWITYSRDTLAFLSSTAIPSMTIGSTNENGALQRGHVGRCALRLLSGLVSIRWMMLCKWKLVQLQVLGLPPMSEIMSIQITQCSMIEYKLK